MKKAKAPILKLKNKIPSEAQEQIWFFKYLKYSFPDIFNVSFHIPNQGYRCIKSAIILSHMGLKKGVPDVFVAAGRGGFHGIFLEFKRRFDSIPTLDQIKMMKLFSEKGYRCEVVFGFDHAVEVINQYLSLK